MRQAEEEEQRPGQFNLFRQRRFLPFFLTQFAGAFNDNLYKNALMLLIGYTGTSVLGMHDSLLLNFAAFLFILPFFFFSAFAGQLADKYEKSAFIRWTKLGEVAIMVLAAIALWFHWYAALLLLLFLTGVLAAFFGPVKYALLPQALREQELVGGNALVEMGTFVAILLGTILGGIMAGFDNARHWIAAGILLVAVLGYFASRGIPTLAAAAPDLNIRFRPWRDTWALVKSAKSDMAVFQSILAISWFWFLGAAYLTQFPELGNSVLAATASGVTLLLAVFTLGIGMGSMLCERLSGHRVELGIVPIGSLGISLFGIDLFFAIPATPSLVPLTPWMMLTDANYLHMLIDLLGIGVFGGFFIVPLYAFVQLRTPATRRARIIAANNIMNALFMVASALLGMLLLGILDLSIPTFFLVIALLNIVVAAYVYSRVPDFALRFIIWMLSHTIYRVKHQGLQHIPEEGAAVLVCNHVSYMDALILAGSVPRPVRFVMDEAIFRMPLLGGFFRLAKTIPIASKRRKPEVYAQAFDAIHQELAAGNLICIFPEGRLTRDGNIDGFRGGIDTILARDAVPVVPMALQGLWGSVFSHKGGSALTHLPKRFWSRIGLVCAPPQAAADTGAQRLEAIVRELRGDRP